MEYRDVVVIGAGPAGLAAGATLGELGANVLVLDEQARVGGQIYRSIESADKSRLALFGQDYAKGQPLAKRFRESGASYEGSATVWQVTPSGEVSYSRNGASKRIRAGHVVVATGAMERPIPFPGWTLPGVMGAGAVNNLAKESGLSPSGSVVLAGSGPLLLLEATLLLKKGVSIAAILETTPALPSPLAILRAPEALLRPE